MVSGSCEVDSFCSIEGFRFWLGEVVRVGVNFLELEIESSRGSDPSWSLTNVSPKPLCFPFLLRSGGFDTFQPCALGTNFHSFSPSDTGLKSTLHHLVLPPSNLLWDWRSHSKGPFYLTQHFYSFSFPLLFMNSLVQSPSPHHQWVR